MDNGRTKSQSLTIDIYEKDKERGAKIVVHPSGLEPETTVPKTVVISISPWVQ